MNVNNVIKFPVRLNIADAVKELENGGLGEVTYATATCLEQGIVNVACDTKVMFALCVMAQRYLNGESL